MAAERYTYRVSWSEEDGEFVATCAEFFSLSHLASNQVAALQGIGALVADVIADLRANGEPVPQPFSERPVSGTFTARVPSDLHRSLMIEAAEAGVSLNRLVSQKLAMPRPVALAPAEPASHDRRRQPVAA
ncbi:MAG: type II toxin-antitoxin system HicB family antitoxin [Acetobacteraceae bacterium]